MSSRPSIRSLFRYLFRFPAPACALFAFGLLLSTSAKAELGLNDISILLPLPSPIEKALLIKPTDGAGGTPLLPREVFNQFPRLLGADTRPNLYDDDLRVIAIRLDPCFTEGVGPQRCRRQLRLVWQPVVMIQSGQMVADDAAVHTFYEYDENTWQSLIREWSSLPSGAESVTEPLQIHPRIASEGLSGPSYARLKNLVLRYCGQMNLVRATAMATSRAIVWAFTGVNITSNQMAGIDIARIGRRAQAYVIRPENLRNLREFQAQGAPFPPEEAEYLNFLSDSAAYQASHNINQIRAVLQRAYVFENPRLSNPGTVDCVSCHTAQIVRTWGESRFGAWNGAGAAYTSAFNLQNTSMNPAQANRIRAFGYFGREPIISQRVINESAQILTPGAFH